MAKKKKAMKKDAKKKAPKKKIAKKKTAMKKKAKVLEKFTPLKEMPTETKAPAPKYALQKDLCKVTESLMILSRDLANMNEFYHEAFHMLKGDLCRIKELIRKKPCLIRKVTVESPNGTITTEETFSSEKN